MDEVHLIFTESRLAFRSVIGLRAEMGARPECPECKTPMRRAGNYRYRCDGCRVRALERFCGSLVERWWFPMRVRRR